MFRRSSSSCNRERLRSKVTHSGNILEELRAKSEHHGSILRILSKHGYCKVRVSREVGYCAAVSGWSIQSKWSRRMSSQPIIVISLPKIVLFIRAQEFMPCVKRQCSYKQVEKLHSIAFRTDVILNRRRSFFIGGYSR
jgi:hypothetical protein